LLMKGRLILVDAEAGVVLVQITWFLAVSCELGHTSILP
jgi:hypothetical protein